MRKALLLQFFGRFHLLVAIVLLVPMAVGFAYQRLIWPFLLPSIAATIIGVSLLLLRRGAQASILEGIRRREGFLLVSGSWILIILHGALPYWIHGAIDDPASAIFESASGFTTTGATILRDIESLPESLLFWRSFSHWLGGMGIIVLSVAILPELAVGGMQLFSAESSGLSVDRLAPRIAQTSKRLWVLYVALTVVEIAILMLCGMDLYHATNHAFATLATGGFSTRNESVAGFDSVWIDVVITIFMFVAGVNFALLYRGFRGEWKRVLRSTEVRLYTFLTVGVTGLITVDLLVVGAFDGIGETLRYSTFQVVSIITTTGYGTADFETWPTFSQFLIVILMTIGGCAGSTAGGLKVIRLVVVLKHAARECQQLLFPRMVKPVVVDGKAIDESILFSILGFFLLYMMTFLSTVLVLSILPHEHPMDLTTATTASLSALNSIGPGLGLVGPTDNFDFIHWGGKLVLSFCMVLGRLEIYTLLVLFMPRFWRGR